LAKQLLFLPHQDPGRFVVVRILVVSTLLAALAVPLSARAEDGKALYEKKCKVCHSLGGDAGKMAEKGGALDGIGSKRDEAWLRAYFADPKSKIPDAKMPKLKLTPAEWDALVAYMLSLK
jgi:nitric oxide reductase subunit C